MKLKVPLYRQPKKSVSCGPFSLKMLYHYYGEKRDIKDILSEVTMVKNGTYASELGRSLMKNNFEVSITALDSKFLPYEYRKFSKKEIIKRLKEQLKSKKEGKIRLKSMISFLEEGGKLNIKVTSLKELLKAIKNKNPPILCIERRVLYGKKLKDVGHFVLLTGITKNKMVINDPQGTYGGVKAYPISLLLFAIYSWRGYVIFAKPKK